MEHQYVTGTAAAGLGDARTHLVQRPGEIVVVTTLVDTWAPRRLGRAKVMTENVFLPGGTAIFATHASAPPAAGTQPGVVLLKFIVIGASADEGVSPFTLLRMTSTDCIVAEAPLAGAGTRIENDALPSCDCGRFPVPPLPLQPVSSAQTEMSAAKTRASTLIVKSYYALSTKTSRLPKA
jgi:hypothetical protein